MKHYYLLSASSSHQIRIVTLRKKCRSTPKILGKFLACNDQWQAIHSNENGHNSLCLTTIPSGIYKIFQHPDSPKVHQLNCSTINHNLLSFRGKWRSPLIAYDASYINKLARDRYTEIKHHHWRRDRYCPQKSPSWSSWDWCHLWSQQASFM